MAEWTGLEPATPCVTGRYSNQLNYHSSLLSAPSLPENRCRILMAFRTVSNAFHTFFTNRSSLSLYCSKNIQQRSIFNQNLNQTRLIDRCAHPELANHPWKLRTTP